MTTEKEQFIEDFRNNPEETSHEWVIDLAWSLQNAGIWTFLAHVASEEDCQKLIACMDGPNPSGQFMEATQAGLEKITMDAINEYIQMLQRAFGMDEADTAGKGFGGAA